MKFLKKSCDVSRHMAQTGHDAERLGSQRSRTSPVTTDVEVLWQMYMRVLQERDAAMEAYVVLAMGTEAMIRETALAARQAGREEEFERRRKQMIGAIWADAD